MPFLINAYRIMYTRLGLGLSFFIYSGLSVLAKCPRSARGLWAYQGTTITNPFLIRPAFHSLSAWWTHFYNSEKGGLRYTYLARHYRSRPSRLGFLGLGSIALFQLTPVNRLSSAYISGGVYLLSRSILREPREMGGCFASLTNYFGFARNPRDADLDLTDSFANYKRAIDSWTSAS